MPRFLARPAPDRRPAIAVLLAASAAAAVALAAHRRSGQADHAAQPAPVVPGPPSEAPVGTTVEQTWSCDCGQDYRVQGEDRHRIYWLADASISDPVLSSDCPNSTRPLPREHGEALTT